MTKKLQPIEPEVFGNGFLPENRRGVLLLIVLSMLTLFMMLGTTYLVVASRAKATAKAFANSGEFSKTARAASGERLVNEAFLKIARGSSSTMPDLPAGDDLLGDKYGTSSRTGNVIYPSLSASGSTVIKLEVEDIAPAVTDDVSELAGCVLTFTLPDLSNISVRIIRAEDNNGNGRISLFIPGGLTASGENITSEEINAAKLKRPSSSLPDFIINGREFSGIAGTNKNESWDGFDSENPFLAQILPSATAPFTPTVERSSFKGKPPASPTPDWIDNDGDGLIDSQWLDLGFPMFVDKNGTSYQAKAAVLVLDLDGRINLNAHGSGTDVENPSNSNEFNIGKNFYPDVTANPMGGGMATLIVPMATLPRGAGRGPAEISVAVSKVTGDIEDPNIINSTGLPEMLSGDQGQTRTNPDAATGREKPKLNNVEGRYGDTPWNPNTIPLLLTAKPGVPNFNDNSSFDKWVGTPGKIFFLDTASRYYSSPSDLKGRMRIWVDEFGQPNYYKPYWDAATGRTEDSNRVSCDDEVVDDPYEVRLGRNGFRTGWIHDPSTGGLSTSTAADNLYTPADLEGILRYLDADSLKLPRRLVSLSRDWASQNRLSVTTESWDSPVVGSSAFMTAVAQLASRTPTSYLMFSPETLMGHRIDLNRPFHDTSTYEPNDGLANDGLGKSRRQTFAKHLYAAAYALAGNGVDITPAEARELAQWAINMVDFRDTDTTITGFEFDTTLTNGWQVDNDLSTTNDSNNSADRAVVWGCERPEILLTEAICWHDRGTEDAAIGGTLVDKDTTQRDDDFDQKRRPQGAFFFELYSPWQSRAFTFDKTSNSAKSVKVGTEDVRGEPVPYELDAFTTNPMNESPGYSTSARLDLARKSSGGFPVWRIVSVKRSTPPQSYGPPALKPNVNDPGDASLGANTPVVHRVFYFTKPLASSLSASGDPAAGKPAFWCNQTFLPLDPHQPLSFGTPAVRTGITQNSGAFAQVAIDRVYDSSNNSPQTRPATLTEPVAQNPKDDPYHILAQSLGSGLAGNSSQLQSTVDQPLDDVSANGINPLLGPDDARVLFQNGLHANFFFLHLQRLADPTLPWNAKTNPYQTIDTLPVDLTVVNYDGIGANAANHDEPCVVPGSNPPTPGGPFVDLFAKQRDYGPISVERGNTIANPANYDFDIWSARVYAGAPPPNTANNDNDYRLLSSGDLPSQRDALPVQESPNPQQDATLRAAPQPTKTNSFNLLASRFGAGNSGVPSRPFPWLFWANRPFNSAVEVAMVPRTSSFELLRKHSTANAAKPFGHLPGFFDTDPADLAAPWTFITGRTNVMIPPITSFLDLVHVASPFSDIYGSAPSNMLTSVGLDVFPYNQFSHFREPGRVNVNTVTSKNVWEALFGKTDPASLPAWNKDLLSGSGSPAKPAKSLLEVFQKIKDPTVPKLGFLDFHNDEISFEDTNHDGILGEDTNANGILDMGEDTNANGILDMGEDTNANGVLDTPNDDYRNTDKNIFFRYQTMNRLANNVTVRSNVFAIWITVGFFENGLTKELGSDTGEIDRHRGFFLFDRSIPVGYETGKDHNVTDAVLLRRIIP